MIQYLSKVLLIDEERISVKATTNVKVRLHWSERGHCHSSNRHRIKK